MRRRDLVIATSLLLATAAAASADTILIAGSSSGSTEALGGFAGSIDWSYDGLGSAGTLVVTLTNTSEPKNGGFITGFLFNFATTSSNYAVALTGITGVGDASLWSVPTGGGLNGNPYGNPFMTGAAINGQFQGGGGNSAGLGVGDTGVFTFAVTADDLASLTASSFVAGGQYLKAPDYEHDFIVRFRGFADGGSDKVPAVVVTETTTTTVVPVPAPVALAGLGLLGVMVLRRRWTGRL